MREMLSPTSAIMGKGLGDKVAFLTDGRFSGGTHGCHTGFSDGFAVVHPLPLNFYPLIPEAIVDPRGSHSSCGPDGSEWRWH